MLLEVPGLVEQSPLRAELQEVVQPVREALSSVQAVPLPLRMGPVDSIAAREEREQELVMAVLPLSWEVPVVLPVVRVVLPR